MPKPSRPLWIVSSLVLLSFGGDAPHAGADPQAPPRAVTVVIDYNDGVQKHFTQIAWQPGMTVLAAMEAAQKHPRGIRFAYRGRQATAFLYRIDDLENEANGRNWLFRVNGELADRSFGVRRLAAGDTVLWRYEEYQ